MGGNSLPATSSDNTRSRTPWPLIVVAVLLVVVPFIAWYGTWFGRTLSDDDIDRYLSDHTKPRHVQHALAEIERRISSRDEEAKRWYAGVASLADHPEKEFRLTAAWVMGADARSEEFHAALVKLVQDSEPIVRRNAALSLVGYRDARAVPVLREMLHSLAVKSQNAGTAQAALTEGEIVRRDSLLVKILAQQGDVYEVRSPVDGRIEKALIAENGSVGTQTDVFILAPDPVAVGDALEGLKYLGGNDDLAEVERYAQGIEGMPEYIKSRATQAAEAIRRRATIR